MVKGASNSLSHCSVFRNWGLLIHIEKELYPAVDGVIYPKLLSPVEQPDLLSQGQKICGMIIVLKYLACFHVEESHHCTASDLVLNFLTDWINVYVTTKLLLIKFSLLIKCFSRRGGIL